MNGEFWELKREFRVLELAITHSVLYMPLRRAIVAGDCSAQCHPSTNALSARTAFFPPQGWLFSASVYSAT